MEITVWNSFAGLFQYLEYREIVQFVFTHADFDSRSFLQYKHQIYLLCLLAFHYLYRILQWHSFDVDR